MKRAADFVWQSYRQFGPNVVDLLAIEMEAPGPRHRLKRIGLMTLAMMTLALVTSVMFDAVRTSDPLLALRVLDVVLCGPILVHLGSRAVRAWS